MARLEVRSFSVSVDGFGAGPNQDLQNPLGVGGMALHEWLFKTRTFQSFHPPAGKEVEAPGGETGVDDGFAARGFENVGAWILGRNMFGPVRGPWLDDAWKGWWGDTPPYHVPVFVLTHHARPPLIMEGGTTFYFVTDGEESALKQAKEAAAGKDVRIGGGVSVIRHYLSVGQIDEMHLAFSPVLLGEGEPLFSGIDLARLGYTPSRTVPGQKATHVLITRL